MLAIFMLTLSGCSLDEVIYDSPVVSQVLSAESDIPVVLTGLYAEQAVMFRNSQVYLPMCNSVEVGLYSNVGPTRIWLYDATEGYIRDVYQNCYRVINNANLLLDAIGKIEFQNTDNRDQYIGEVSFIRSFAYFNLVRLFGKVPIILEPTRADMDFSLSRSSVDDVYTVIFDGFEKGSILTQVNIADRGRIRKGAAQALLAEAYLTYANFLDLHGRSGEAPGYYQLAVDYADSVINSGSYSLIASYADLFDNSQENAAYQEVIFGINFTADDSDQNGSPFPRHFAPPKMHNVSGLAPDGESSGIYGITQWVYDLCTSGDYGMPDGTKDFRMGEIMVPTRYQDDDATIANGEYTEVTSYPQVRNAPEDVDPSFNLPNSIKYVDPSGLSPSNHNNDYFYIRLAEIYLIKAEALNEVSGPSQEALDAINQLRYRSRNSSDVPNTIPADLVLTDVPTKEELRMKIWEERLIELYTEGRIYFDERRMRYSDNTRTMLQYVIEDVYPTLQVGGEYKELTFNSATNQWEGSKIYPPRVPPNGWEEKWLLWPIPSVNYSLNPGMEGDYNPGW